MISQGPVELTVDRHELASLVPELLARCPDLRVTTATLECGDYAVGRALGIERKTADDLARSLVDGRLFRQMSGLRQGYRRPLLLVEALGRPCITYALAVLERSA